MSYAFTAIKGLTLYDRANTFPGMILLVPVDGQQVWLIDVTGNVIHHWDTKYKPIWAELLLNGNMMYAGKGDKGPLADLEGAAGKIQEVDWSGRVVWEYADPYLHHGFFRMKSGNTLVIKW